jgi:predicted XRE-type DNA-binding protein
MSPTHDIHTSSGNVFRDLGLRDADKRLAKAELARVIRRVVGERGLTQLEAAELLGASQPDVSDIACGKLARFSMDRLERFLNILDMEIRIQVGPRSPLKGHAGISVEEVGAFGDS